MISFSSTGDLSRSFHLRLANQNAKNQIDKLAHEATTGLKFDIAKSSAGNLSQINHLESRIQELESFKKNIYQANLELSTVQTTLASINDLITDNRSSLLAGSSSKSHQSMLIHAAQAAGDLQSVIAMLNNSFAGRFIFSGLSVNTPPLVDYNNILAQVTTAISGATSAADIISAVDQWFDGPAGSGGFLDNAYNGSETPRTAVSSDIGTDIKTSVTASNPAILEALKGFTLAALAWDRHETIQTDNLIDLMSAAGQRLTNATSVMNELRSQVGIQEQATERMKVRNESETASLQILLNGIMVADPYETATALKEAESNLQNIYAITARITSMKLTDYLR